MPKVVEKGLNPAALLMSKRPPASRLPAEQTFERALRDAQPKREPPPNPQTDEPKPVEKAPPASDEAAADEVQGEQAADETAMDAPIIEEEGIESDAESTTSTDEPKDEPEEAPADSTAVPIELIPVPVAIPVTPEELSDTVDVEIAVDGLAEVKETDAPIVRSVIAADSVVELPDEPVEGVPGDVADPAADEQIPSFPVAAAQKPVVEAGQAGDPAVQAAPIDENAVLPVEPIAEGDDEPAEEQDAPKLKLAQPVVKDESADDELPQAFEPVEAVATKEVPVTVEPRAIEVQAPKAANAPAQVSAPIPLPPPPPQTDAELAQNNHDRIVTSVKTQLLPNGGSMRLRLDPPELGSLQIHVRMINGVMQASFETSSDHATRLLSHSLSHLKTALESQGVSVDKLQVQQAPREQGGQSAGEDQQQRNPHQQESEAQREQQRRELLNRMWRRMRLGRDPLDMVA